MLNIEILKQRNESRELKVYRSLLKRTKLSHNDFNYYSIILKGFEGELKFDALLKKVSIEGLVLNDLLIEFNNTEFQIDTLFITQETIYLFDVKNYESDYYIEKGDWYTIAGTLTKNPLTQLKRCETSLRQLLQLYRYSLPIQPYLIFVNPYFHLYNAPRDQPIIFPAQIDQFMSRLNKKPSKLKAHHYTIAKKLASIHKEESDYSRLPGYQCDQLKKGVLCAGCGSIILKYNGKVVICRECGYTENTTSSVLRCVDEFKLLFPNKKITTHHIHEWCRIFSKKTVYRVLSTHFQQIGKRKSTYFI